MAFYIYALVKHPERSVDVEEGKDLVGFMEMSQEDARKKAYRWQNIKNLEHQFLQRYPEPKMSEDPEKWEKNFYTFYFMNTRILYGAYAELQGEKSEYYLPTGRYAVGQILPSIPMDAVAVQMK